MQFDQLHSTLFALAKKGTQDTHFDVSASSRVRHRRNNIRVKAANTKGQKTIADKRTSTSTEATKNLKNLQFTLFD